MSLNHANQNSAAQAADHQTVLSFDERERILCQFISEPINHDREMARAIESATQEKLLAPLEDYERVLADHRRLVRELDVLLNGDGGAPQASLCDIVAQVRRDGVKASAPVSDIREGFELTYAANADDPACASDLSHFTNGWQACIMSQVGKPVVVNLEVDATAAIARINDEAARLRAPVAAPSDETLRLAGVIADKIEDGTLFQAGIFSRRELADRVRAVVLSVRVASAPVAGEALNWRHSTTGYKLYDKSGKVIDPGKTALYAAPQASAEDVRNAALEEAAKIAENSYADAHIRIRALKQPHADKDGGRQRAGDVDDRKAWADDMLAAGAKHLGGDCWEWESDDFILHLWQVATRRQRRAAFDHPVFAFLLGEGLLHGVDFGERAPGAVGKWWWRKDLRAALTSATQREQGERDA